MKKELTILGISIFLFFANYLNGISQIDINTSIDKGLIVRDIEDDPALDQALHYLNIAYMYSQSNPVNYVKADIAIDQAKSYLLETDDKYWEAVYYEFYGHVLYSEGRKKEALRWYYKAYMMYLDDIFLIDGSDDALFHLIKYCYPNDWKQLIDTNIYYEKIRLKMEKGQGVDSTYTPLKYARHYWKLSITYLQVFGCSGEPQNEISESFLMSANRYIDKITNKYWLNSINVANGFLGIANKEKKTKILPYLHNAYMGYRKTEKKFKGCKDALYQLIRFEYPKFKFVK